MINKLEEYAKINNIPIMQKDGIEYLMDYIKENNYKTILEIGTAIGYSAICMASVDNDIKITSIERDKVRYDIAIKNIEEANLSNRINVIYADALDIEIKENYDLIFIDAAKSKSIEFFNKYKNLLIPNGSIVTDNLDFHGLREKKNEIKYRNTRQLMNKIDKYIEFLNENKEFKSTFLKVGDGISISKIKNT